MSRRKELENKKKYDQRMGDKERMNANLEHFESVASGQSEENRNLRTDIDTLKSKLASAEETNREVIVNCSVAAHTP